MDLQKIGLSVHNPETSTKGRIILTIPGSLYRKYHVLEIVFWISDRQFKSRPNGLLIHFNLIGTMIYTIICQVPSFIINDDSRKTAWYSNSPLASVCSLLLFFLWLSISVICVVLVRPFSFCYATFRIIVFLEFSLISCRCY